MHRQAYEQCDTHGQPKPIDSLQSLCWPVVSHTPPVIPEARIPSQRVDWPLSEPWRRNIGQPRCQGEGRCQGDARRCNSKYRYGVDDVGRCPSRDSCQASYTCRNRHVAPGDCPDPCPKQQDCNRPTTRCFDWPIPDRERCPPIDPNADHRPQRPDLTDKRGIPECCPTCHRALVDLESGPLSMNY